MKTTKLYKLLLLLPFFISLPSLASDSLKVKKTEYYEDGKLVRTTFFNKNEKKMKEYFYNYIEGFDGRLQNNIFIFKFKDGEHYSITDYYIKIEENDVIYYNAPFIGSIQSIERDSSGHYTEANAITLTLKDSYSRRICSLDSLEFIPVIHSKGFNQKYYYDKFANIIEIKYVDKQNFGKKTLYQYDSLHKQIGYITINKPYKTIVNIGYHKNFSSITTERFLKHKLFKKILEKVFKNENEQEFRKETYQIPLKKSKPIGEPKLTFSQENIYENDRIVKIIYEDLLLGKKKVHELKYEFY